MANLVYPFATYNLNFIQDKAREATQQDQKK